MSSPISSVSLAESLRQKQSAYFNNAALSVIGGLGAPANAFSRTLQGQLDRSPSAPGNNPPSPPSNPNPPRNEAAERPAERAKAPETPRDPARKDAAQSSSQDSRRSESAQAASQDTAASSKDTTAAGEAAESQPGKSVAKDAAAEQTDASTATTALTAEEAAALALVVPETQAGNALPHALAGLPAAIAALMPRENEAFSTDVEAEAAMLASDSKGKSLQNPALLNKGDTKSELTVTLGDRGNASAAAVFQGRLATTGATASTAQSPALSLTGESAKGLQAGNPGAQNANSASALHHGTGALNILRPAPATQAATPQLPVHTPAGQQAWAQDVGNQVRWMLGRAESKAELVLTPPNMGKLEVSINLNGDQTTAQFVASSQAARDALERAMPQLRELLQQAGINLGETNVSTSSDQGARGDGDGTGKGGRGNNRAGSDDGAAQGSTVTTNWQRQHDGMVDTFV